MSFLHQKPARLLLAASALGLLVIVGAVFATKDLIPTGNVPCNGSCQRDCVGSYPSRQRCCAASAAHSAETSSTTDCVRQARPQELLRASAAHSSGRISSKLKLGVSPIRFDNPCPHNQIVECLMGLTGEQAQHIRSDNHPDEHQPGNDDWWSRLWCQRPAWDAPEAGMGQFPWRKFEERAGK